MQYTCVAAAAAATAATAAAEAAAAAAAEDESGARDGTCNTSGIMMGDNTEPEIGCVKLKKKRGGAAAVILCSQLAEGG